MKLRQVHSGTVQEIDDTSAAGDPVEGDASLTALEGAALGVQTADCIPILVTDSDARCVAAIHAGWRGTAARIAESTIRRLCVKFEVRPTQLTVAIGPHIGVCCYEVGEEVVKAISDPDAVERRSDWVKPHLNLASATTRQLLGAGVLESAIATSSLCTQCREDLFFSYRREGKRSGRMLSVIGIRP